MTFTVEEEHKLDEVMVKTTSLFQREYEQQVAGDHSHSALHEIDDYLKTFEVCRSKLVVMGAIRSTYKGRKALKNWKPLLRVAMKRWPDEKSLFVGLTKELED